jgi:toxin ParE1/3/4
VAEYILTQKAKSDLLDIIEYTRNTWGKRQIRIYIDAIEERCQILAGNPDIGKDADELAPDLLSHPIESHVIYYKRQGDDIFVIRVLHKRMLPDMHL